MSLVSRSCFNLVCWLCTCF